MSSKVKDTGSGAMQGAAMGTMVLPGWGTAIGAGIGGLGGYFGMMPGTGGGGEAKKRTDDIAQAQAMLREQQRLSVGHRQATMQGLGQLYGPANDRLARMYGQGARVQMPPQQQSPLEQMFAQQPPRGPGSV